MKMYEVVKHGEYKNLYFITENFIERKKTGKYHQVEIADFSRGELEPTEINVLTCDGKLYITEAHFNNFLKSKEAD